MTADLFHNRHDIKHIVDQILSSIANINSKMVVRLTLNFCLLVFSLDFLKGAAGQLCGGDFVEPDECFDPEELRELADNAKRITTLYNNYIGIMTESRFTIEDDEVRKFIKFLGRF